MMFWPVIYGMTMFRFVFQKAPSAKQQIMNFMSENPESGLWVWTDSGGPYYQIRESAVAMAIESGRDIQGFRIISHYHLYLWRHRVSLPFNKLEMKTTPVIAHARLKEMGVQASTQMLQNMMDSIEASPVELKLRRLFPGLLKLLS